MSLLWLAIGMPLSALLMLLEFITSCIRLFFSEWEGFFYGSRRNIVDFFNASFAKYKAQKSANKDKEGQ